MLSAGCRKHVNKWGSDLRLLAHKQEVDEPFEKDQIGSSAMAYKRNPMRAERLCSLARYLGGLPAMAAQTQAHQWFERTLDDSAARRLYIPQAFLCADAMLRIANNIAQGLVVHQSTIDKHVKEYLPYMITENWMMAAVAQGADRQDVHEIVRKHSHAVTARVKDGTGNSQELIALLQQEPAFAGIDASTMMDASLFVGRAPEQVDEFIQDRIAVIRHTYAGAEKNESELSV